MRTIRSVTLAIGCVVSASFSIGWAADDGVTTANTGVSLPEIQQLQAQLEQQQKQIEQLRAALEAQQKLLERAAASQAAPSEPDRKLASLREVASTAPI